MSSYFKSNCGLPSPSQQVLVDDWCSAEIELRQWMGNQRLQQKWVRVLHYSTGGRKDIGFNSLKFLKEFKA